MSSDQEEVGPGFPRYRVASVREVDLDAPLERRALNESRSQWPAGTDVWAYELVETSTGAVELWLAPADPAISAGSVVQMFDGSWASGFHSDTVSGGVVIESGEVSATERMFVVDP